VGDDQSGSLQAGFLPQIKVGIVNAHRSPTGLVAQAYPGADSLGVQCGAGARLIGGLFQPEGVPADLHEALPVEIDGTVLTGGLAIPADTHAAVAWQVLFQKRDLFRGRFLHTQDVGPSLVEGRPQGVFPAGPVEPLPREALVLAAMDVPGDYSDHGRVPFRWRLWSTRAERQPHDQTEPNCQKADEHQPRRLQDAMEPPLAAGRRCGLGRAAKAEDESHEDGSNHGEGPPDVSKSRQEGDPHNAGASQYDKARHGQGQCHKRGFLHFLVMFPSTSRKEVGYHRQDSFSEALFGRTPLRTGAGHSRLSSVRSAQGSAGISAWTKPVAIAL
jgi:hypothetical protein